LIVLDDESSDATAALAVQAAGSEDRFRLLSGKALPSGWLGKNWACHQLSMAASGDLLLFLDADVQLQPTALAALVTALIRENAELLTVWPSQITKSWSERLVVPLIAYALLGYLPVLAVHKTHWPVFAAANGQCLFFRRSAYHQAGGHAAVRGNVIEDVALAREFKRRAAASQKTNKTMAGKIRAFFSSPLHMVDGNQLVACRMYPNGWVQVRDGFAKNILAGHGGSVSFLVVSSIFHVVVFILPWIWWLFGGGWWPFVLGVSGLLLRALTAAFSRQRILDALLMPISVLLMVYIAGQSIFWHFNNAGHWKGRTLKGEL
jgi:chlorobactene glucosyltransferase